MSVIFKHNKFIDSDSYIEPIKEECEHIWNVIVNKDYYAIICDLEKDIHYPLTFKCTIDNCNMIRCYHHLPNDLLYYN